MPRTPRAPSRLILGLDPALRTLGWSVARETDGAIEPLALGVVRTKPDPKLSKTLDNFDAALKISAALLRLIRWTPDGAAEFVTIAEIRAEAMSYPPSASSAAKISLCWGAIATISALYAIPVYEASPQAIKRAVVGVPSASKNDVRNALEKAYGRARIASMLAGLSRELHEHPIDGLAATVAIGARRSAPALARHPAKRRN